jgi:hypothetical protein
MGDELGAHASREIRMVKFNSIDKGTSSLMEEAWS